MSQWSLFDSFGPSLVHRKNDHIEKVNICYYFLQGVCDFGEDCWYNHRKEDLELKIKCNLCDNTFKCKPDLMLHRKEQHSENVKQCRNEPNENCKFGKAKCWFIHTECKEN